MFFLRDTNLILSAIYVRTAPKQIVEHEWIGQFKLLRVFMHSNAHGVESRKKNTHTQFVYWCMRREHHFCHKEKQNWKTPTNWMPTSAGIHVPLTLCYTNTSSQVNWFFFHSFYFKRFARKTHLKLSIIFSTPFNLLHPNVGCKRNAQVVLSSDRVGFGAVSIHSHGGV